MTFWGGWKNSLNFLNNLSVDHILKAGSILSFVGSVKSSLHHGTPQLFQSLLIPMPHCHCKMHFSINAAESHSQSNSYNPNNSCKQNQKKWACKTRHEISGGEFWKCIEQVSKQQQSEGGAEIPAALRWRRRSWDWGVGGKSRCELVSSKPSNTFQPQICLPH